MIRRVTFCTMLQTDGHIQVYGIFRGKLQRADRAKSEQYINLHLAVRVGVESSPLGPTEFDYFEAARRYATDKYPHLRGATRKREHSNELQGTYHGNRALPAMRRDDRGGAVA